MAMAKKRKTKKSRERERCTQGSVGIEDDAMPIGNGGGVASIEIGGGTGSPWLRERERESEKRAML